MAYENSTFNLQIRDHSGQSKTTSVPIALITGANMATRITQRDTLIDAIEDMVEGKIIKSELTLRKKFNSGNAAAATASVSRALTVEYADTVTMEEGSFSFGCYRDDRIVIIPGTDNIYITDGGDEPAGTEYAAALVAAVEAFVVSPRGNAVGVLNIRKEK